MDVPLVLAAWLHTLAFVIAWGYYGILGRIVLPGLERSLDGVAQAGTLVAIERRAMPLVVLSALIFLVTGTYLLVSSPSYSGLGDVFASTWTTPHPTPRAPIRPQPSEFAGKQGESDATVKSPASVSQNRGSTSRSVPSGK